MFLPKFPEFTELTLNHQSILKQYTLQFPPYSDYTFSSLWCWNLDNSCRLSDLNDNLVILFADYLTQQSFISFLGNHSINETVGTLLEAIKQFDCSPHLQLIPDHNFTKIALDKRYKLIQDIDGQDYVYDLDDLAQMAGRKYQAHRNFINRFTNNYQWHVELLDLRQPQTWHEINNLLKVWITDKTAQGIDVSNDLQAVTRLSYILDQIDLTIVGLYVSKQLVGYTINEHNQHNYATNLFEHADTSYVGVFRVLKQQTAIKLLDKGYKYWSHQQDLGIPGLRRSKQSYRPKFYLKKWSIGL